MAPRSRAFHVPLMAWATKRGDAVEVPDPKGLPIVTRFALNTVRDRANDPRQVALCVGTARDWIGLVVMTVADAREHAASILRTCEQAEQFDAAQRQVGT